MGILLGDCYEHDLSEIEVMMNTDSDFMGSQDN